jgi:hypothetical protein
MTLESELKEEDELDICPLLKNGKCQSADDENLENYCVLNYDACELYILYKKNNFEAD